MFPEGLQFLFLSLIGFALTGVGPQMRDIRKRIAVLEALLRKNGSLPQNYEPPQPKGAWGSYLDGLREVGDYLQLSRSKGAASSPASIHPRRVTERPATLPQSEEADVQTQAAQPGSAASIAQLFAAIRAKEGRQAAGQWTDPQVERAVQAATEALVDRNLNETEIVQRVDAALKALEYHATGWDNVQKK